eukprot:m.40424 g.40424  ORF g.40424 m.40424 type:complete len:1234 (+) comp9663_c0_seq2:283-3984(+)
MFVGRVILRPNEHISPSIECLAATTSKAKDIEKTWLWCGLSSGEVQLVDFESRESKKRFQLHKQVVTCILPFAQVIWTCSFDSTIKVTDIKSKKVVLTLTEHTDAITSCIRSGDDVWSASLNGELIKWNCSDPRKPEKLNTFLLRSPISQRIFPLYSIAVDKDYLWIGTSTSIIQFFPATAEILSRLPAPEHEYRGIVKRDLDHDATDTTQRNRGSSFYSPAPMQKEFPQESKNSIPEVMDESQLQPSQYTPGIWSKPSETLATRMPLSSPRRTNSSGESDLIRSGSGSNNFSSPVRRNSFGSTPRLSPFSKNANSRNKSDPEDSFKSPGKSGGVLLGFQPRKSTSTRMSSIKDHKTRLITRPTSEISGTKHTDDKKGDKDTREPKTPPHPLSSTFKTITQSSANSARSVTPPHVNPERPKNDYLSLLAVNEDTATWGGGGAAAYHSPPKHLSGRVGKGPETGPDTSPQGRPFTAQFPIPFPKDVAASHCVIEGSKGELWSSSEKRGVVQVWSTETHKLLQHWDLDGCTGITQLVYSRKCVWAAAQNGSVYIFDAVAKEPIVELKVHTDAVRYLCAAKPEYMVSSSAAKDGSLAILLNLARGRHGYVSWTSDSATVFDRYGFFTSGRGVPEGFEDLGDELVASLPSQLEIELDRRQRAFVVHSERWTEYLQRNKPDPALPFFEGHCKPFRDSPELRNLIENGVPDACRQQVWTKLINQWVGDIRNRKGPNYYNRLAREHHRSNRGRKHRAWIKQIDLDLHRTFPTNKYFNLDDGAALKKLRRVLIAFSRYSTKVGYCQGFNFIAGFALLFLTEEMAFWCMAALIGGGKDQTKSVIPSGYFVDPMRPSRADQPVLRELIKKYCPTIDNVLESQCFDLSLITFNWFFTLYVDAVPTVLTLRIWDMILYRGDFFSFQIAFAILKINEDLITSLDNPADLFEEMRKIGKRCTDADRAMQIACNECDITEDETRILQHSHQKLLEEYDEGMLAEGSAKEDSSGTSLGTSLESHRHSLVMEQALEHELGVTKLEDVEDEVDVSAHGSVTPVNDDVVVENPTEEQPGTEDTNTQEIQSNLITEGDPESDLDDMPKEDSNKETGSSTDEEDAEREEAQIEDESGLKQFSHDSSAGSSWEKVTKDSMFETETAGDWHMTTKSASGTGDGKVSKSLSGSLMIKSWISARMRLPQPSQAFKRQMMSFTESHESDLDDDDSAGPTTAECVSPDMNTSDLDVSSDE